MLHETAQKALRIMSVLSSTAFGFLRCWQCVTGCLSSIPVSMSVTVQLQLLVAVHIKQSSFPCRCLPMSLNDLIRTPLSLPPSTQVWPRLPLRAFCVSTFVPSLQGSYGQIRENNWSLNTTFKNDWSIRYDL